MNTPVDGNENRVEPNLNTDRLQVGLLKNSVYPTSLNRQKIIEAGLFAEYLHGADDWHLWRCVAARTDFLFLPEVLAKVRLHNSNTSNNFAHMRQDCFLATEQMFADSVITRDMNAATLGKLRRLSEANTFSYDYGRAPEIFSWANRSA